MQILDSFEVGKQVDGKRLIYVKVIVLHDDSLYIGKWHDRRTLPDKFTDLEDARLIQTQNRGPLPDPKWTKAVVDSDVYIKSPALEDFLDSKLEERMIHEITLCELLTANFHPFLAEYKGYIEQNGRVSGLAMKKHTKTLLEHVNPGRLNKQSFMEDSRSLVTESMKQWLIQLRSAVDHLHELGLVHNDITPANITLDDTSSPVLIDFEGLRKMGDSLHNVKRTRGWHDPANMVSLKSNDLDALAEIHTWMFGTVSDLTFVE